VLSTYYLLDFFVVDQGDAGIVTEACAELDEFWIVFYFLNFSLMVVDVCGADGAAGIGEAEVKKRCDEEVHIIFIKSV
jgi:hypothetical protein